MTDTDRSYGTSFLMDIYDAANGSYVGPAWNSSHLGGVMPAVGDVIFAPLSDRDRESPRDPDKFFAWEIKKIYFVPDLEGGPCIVKALTDRRELTDIERKLIK